MEASSTEHRGTNGSEPSDTFNNPVAQQDTQPASSSTPNNVVTTEDTLNNETNDGNIDYSASAKDLVQYYKDVSALKMRGGLKDSLGISEHITRRVAYLEEAVTYNVYVGGLGEEVDENDLFHYFSPCGPIDSCRVFRATKDDPFHKYVHPSLCPDVGYAFIHFITQEGQTKALSKEFNRPKIKNSCGYTKIAVEKTTLFVGGLPISMKEHEVTEMFQAALINFRTIILKTGPPPTCTSRGFCFMSFDTHKAAEATRQILGSGPVQGKTLTVGWAEPQSEDDDEMDKVTTLFINNLASHVIDEQLKTLFSPYGEILKCRVVRHLQTLESRGFAFVEYSERDSCMRAMEKLNGTDFYGEKLTVTLARPLDYRNRAGPSRPFPAVSSPPPRGRAPRDKFYPPYSLYPPYYPYPPVYPPPHYRYHPYSRQYHYDYYYPGYYDYGYGGYFDALCASGYYPNEYTNPIENGGGAPADRNAAYSHPQIEQEGLAKDEFYATPNPAAAYGDQNFWQQYQTLPPHPYPPSSYAAHAGAYPTHHHPANPAISASPLALPSPNSVSTSPSAQPAISIPPSILPSSSSSAPAHSHQPLSPSIPPSSLQSPPNANAPNATDSSDFTPNPIHLSNSSSPIHIQSLNHLNSHNLQPDEEMAIPKTAQPHTPVLLSPSSPKFIDLNRSFSDLAETTQNAFNNGFVHSNSVNQQPTQFTTESVQLSPSQPAAEHVQPVQQLTFSSLPNSKRRPPPPPPRCNRLPPPPKK